MFQTRRSLFIFVSVLIFLFGLLTWNSFVAARHEQVGLAVNPLEYDVAADPGEAFQKEVRVTNVTGMPLTVLVDAADFTVENGSGAMKILTGKESGSNAFDLKSWIKIDEESFDLAPGEERTYHYVISIPKDAGPGGRYGVVRFRSIGQFGEPSIKPDATTGVWQSIYLTVKGNLKNDGRVTDIFASSLPDGEKSDAVLFDSGPIVFTMDFENTGRTHFQPTGSITISGVLGGEETYEIRTSRVLPDKVRRFQYNWKDVPSAGVFRAHVVMRVSGKTVRSKTILFVVFPWMASLAVIIIAATLLLLLLFIRRSRRPRSKPAPTKPQNQPSANKKK